MFSKVIVGLFCMLVIILCVGVLLAFTSGDDQSVTGDDSSGSSGGGGNGGGTIQINPPVVKVVGEPATTKPPNRPGKLFCVVGQNFADAAQIVHFCDYFIYPDLMATGGRFVPLYGNTSWEAFKEVTRAPSSDTVPGVSFSLNQLGQAGSTVELIPTMTAELVNLVQMRINALGLLNFMRHTGGNPVTALDVALQALSRALKGQPDAMTFLGVWLYNTKAVNDFVSEVVAMTSVDTIILQTHMSEPFFSGGPCVSRGVSVKSSTEDLPSFRHAEEAAVSLRAQTRRFRILLSSVLGVLLYIGDNNSPEPSDANKPCREATIVDYDVVCSTNAPTGVTYGDNTDDSYRTVTYTHDNRQYFGSMETAETLETKLSQYVPSVSEGWAVFEVQRDTAGTCTTGGSDYERLSKIEEFARYAP